MRRRSWITAVLAPSCGLLLVFAVAGFPAASETPQPSRTLSSTKPASIQLAASEEAAAPSGETDQGSRPGVPSATILDSRDGRWPQGEPAGPLAHE